MALLDVRDLRVSFDTPDGVVRAVNGLSFSVEPGQTLGIVGESGSGKSVATQTMVGLTRGATVGGEAWFGDLDLIRADQDELRTVRGGQIGMIFQDPLTSLHPLYTVGWQIVELIREHDRASRRRRRGSGRRNCSPWWASRTPIAGWTTTRTSSPAGCGSAS